MTQNTNQKRHPLVNQWRRLRALPGGLWLFNTLVGIRVPYSGSIHANIDFLDNGSTRLRLKDRRRVRNHLHSIHALALANFGELASGLAVLTALPPQFRGIVTGIQVEYVKKARGTLTAQCQVQFGDMDQEQTFQVQADIRDASGETVAVFHANWLLSPKPHG